MTIEYHNPTPIGFYDLSENERHLIFNEIVSKKDLIESLYQKNSWNNYVESTLNNVANIFVDHDFHFCYSITNRYFLMYLNEIKNSFLFLSNSLNSLNLRLRESWFNRTKKHGFQNTHDHVPASISGVYYYDINSPNHHEGIEFNLFTQEEKFCYGSSLEIVYNYAPGRIIFFPSYLPHNVHYNKTNEDRLSFSFNFYSTNGKSNV